MNKSVKKQTIDPAAIGLRILEFVASHKIILIILISSTAIGISLLKTGSFISIPRNEDRFLEGVSKVNYKKINEDTLNSFKTASEDDNPSVHSNFQPGRDNPFTE